MKQAWQKIAARIDALGLRERVLVFAMAVVVVVALINALFLDPQFSKAAALSKQIAQDQSQITGIQADIREKMLAYNSNPDAAKQEKLQQLKQKSAQMRATLQDMQKGVISPDKMAALLEDILRQNGRLRLLSLRTIAPTGLNEINSVANVTDRAGTDKNPQHAAAEGNPKSDKSAGGNVVYKHGFEIVIAGDYRDMVEYMTALESLPWQLFWGKAQLTADESSRLSLTLTLYTLSLDKNWLNI